MKNKINVLYVDDEENNLHAFKATFRLKYNVYTALSGAQALEIVKADPIHIIITDQRMPEMTGVQFLEEVIAIAPNPMRILLTGYADLDAVIDSVNKGKIFHYLSKPWEEKELDDTIQRAYAVYDERQKTTENVSKLEVSNEQLEFMLRQKLLS